MPTFDGYWHGKEKAVITSCSKEWQPALHQEWLKIVTQAFEVYFTARKNLDKCTDSKLTKSMRDDLEYCANVGCNRLLSGVLGLKEAFEHLAKNNGCWSDPIGTYEVMPFYHQKEWSVYKPYWVHGHRAGVRFMEAFDEKTKEGIDALAKLQAQIQKLQGVKDKAGKLTEREARSTAEILKTIKEISEKVEKTLWWVAQAEQLAEVAEASAKIKAFAENLEKCSRYIEKFNTPAGKALGKGTAIADDIVKGYDTYQRATAAGMSEGAAATLATLQKAMEYVPVFGKLYAEVLGGIPNTTDMIQKRSDELKEVMDRVF